MTNAIEFEEENVQPYRNGDGLGSVEEAQFFIEQQQRVIADKFIEDYKTLCNEAGLQLSGVVIPVQISPGIFAMKVELQIVPLDLSVEGSDG